MCTHSNKLLYVANIYNDYILPTRKIYKKRFNHFNMSEEEFKKRYRLAKFAVRVLVGLSNNNIVRAKGRNYALNKEEVEEVVNWVKKSWDKITDSDVSNALRTGYLDKNYSFSDSYIARHEGFGPMIQQEINLLKNQNIIQNLLYDDVSEEAEMTVIE